jgi:hypothetical protein
LKDFSPFIANYGSEGGGSMDKKFLGICVVIASLILSVTLIYTSLFSDNEDRYKVVGNRVFDTQEGKFVDEQEEEMLDADVIELEMTKNEIAQNNDRQILDSSIIDYDIQLPEQVTSTALFSSRNIQITIKNMSNKYFINYIEAEIRLYKDDTVFLKDTIIIEEKEVANGYKEKININPLSSYKTSYQMDDKINYPERPWKAEITTKIVKGFPIE